MRTHAFEHLSDSALHQELCSRGTHERHATADIVLVIAEADARRLYLRFGYPSMHAYCVGELHLAEDAAYKRIWVARAAREVPALLEALTDGRLHLSGARLLARHITPANAEDLLTAAAFKTRAAIEQLVAERFPESESLALVEVAPASPGSEQVPGPVAPEVAPSNLEQVPGPFALALHPGGATRSAAAPRNSVRPIAPERFTLHVTIGKETHEALREAQALLSHCVPSNDIAEVLDRALRELVRKLQKRKHGATDAPRACRPSKNGRHVPAHVRRAVLERDQACCTFVGENGHRCGSRDRLQYDHIQPVARGGRATAENTRLLCQAHNAYEADRVFGAGFMERKRTEARSRGAKKAPEVPLPQAPPQDLEDVMKSLRTLGYRLNEAKPAVAFSATLVGATLEDRVRAALRYLCPRPRMRPS